MSGEPTLAQLIALIGSMAVIVEAIVEYFGDPIPSKYKRYVAATLAVVLCLRYGLDLLVILGFGSDPYVGPLLTGLLIGRGSNYANAFIKRLIGDSVTTTRYLEASTGEAAPLPGWMAPTSPSASPVPPVAYQVETVTSVGNVTDKEPGEPPPT